jgi:acetyltransferase-like isoleucine patch superfamily enzyme
MLKLDRYKVLISRSNPLDLEAWVRALLVHYFFHVSDKQCVEVEACPGVGAPRRVNLLTPTVFKGQGRIRLAANVVFGVPRSPHSHACSYVEARTPRSLIDIGAGTVVNNHAVIVSEGAQIHIGKRCLIGAEFQVLDSNAHQLALGQRHLPDQEPRDVVIEDDVFIGSRVTLLKGCRIGHGSVIAAGSVVPPSFQAAPMSVIAGNPARVVGTVAIAPPLQAQTA